MSNQNFEIERKFLVEELPENLDSYRKVEIEQAYISAKPTIRVRRKDDEYFLTTKSSGDIKRIEYEFNITKEEYESLFNKIEGNIIKKTRYLIPLKNDLLAELDVYHGYLDGLLTVEVEFLSEVQCDKFIKPLWFGKDVSNDKRYKNAILSKGNDSLTED